MAVPYTFGSATSSIPLSQLDSNFATAITLGNTAVYLGNTTTTLNGLTLSNVTISSGNVTITAVTLSNANITGTTTLSGLTASTALALDASKNIVSVTNTGTGNNVLAASPSLTGTVTIATLNLTNALGTGYGGTGLTSFTSGGVVYASSSSALATGSALTFDGATLGVGVAGSAWDTLKAVDIGSGGTVWGTAAQAGLGSNVYYGSGGFRYKATNVAAALQIDGNVFKWFTAPSGTAGNAISFTQAMTLDASGNLLVGTTSTLTASNRKLNVFGAAGGTIAATGTGGEPCLEAWQQAPSGNNVFHEFGTEGTYTVRGSITYNRAGGLTVYNTTSDYRAKDIFGAIADSGSVIDSVPVYMGKMKGATQERPMFIAHETPDYAHTGEKDAVDKDGKPVYQQMDASALIPVMWAEIQSLRKRLADAGI